MISTQDKELERALTIAFLQSMGISNELNLKDCEGPDFILYNSKLIGIEVTEILIESRKKIEEGWQGALDLAQNIWLASGKPQVDVRIMFNDSIHISKNEKHIVANELINLIDGYLPAPGEFYWSTDDLIHLPRGIIEFSIYRSMGTGNFGWSCTDSIWVPELTSEQIQSAISKKEALRKNYLKKCDKIWLLLVLYGRKPSGSFTIPKTVNVEKYQFEFDNVYLFNAFPAETWELQREIPS